MKKGWFLLTATFVLCTTQVLARILNVPGEYSNIQSAINDANNGDAVIVSPGRYQENINFMGKAITVQSIDPNDPNVVAGTIIDGNAPADSNFGSVVIFNSGEDNDSVLSGFTITGGTGSWLSVSWEFKGLRWNRCGGGAVCYNMSAPTISKNIFINNIAGQGGGVYIYGDPVNPLDPSNPTIHVSPVITGNTFINNSAIVGHGFIPPDNNYPNGDHGDGGAIVAFQGCDALITGNSIEDNHADYYGGGLHLRQWSNGLIEDNQIISNDSELGAGVHITYISSPTVRGNLIRDNIASPLGGGGVYIYYFSKPLVERNTITENTSSNGAGIGVYWDSVPTIRSNLIYKNFLGAGVRIAGSSPIIACNTITDNYRHGIDSETGCNPVIENNIITFNGQGWGIWVHTGSSPVIRYNNMWGNGLGTCGPAIPDQTGINGNICISPQFVNPDNNDYHLNYDSGCIDTGDPNFSAGALTDYDGEPRKLGRFIDIGADEAWPIWNITSGGQYGNIQQAINDANNADVIIVIPGTYTGPGNRDIDFKGKAITLRSINPSDPDIVASTIIDCQGSVLQPHRGFYFHSGEDANSIVNGLTVTGGGGCYGAIHCYLNSSPTIRNCIVTNNSMSGSGGGFYCGYNSNPIITNCIISSNTFVATGYGGGIYCYGSSPIITNCVITNNSAVGPGRHGGGICCWGDQYASGNALVANCIISGNSADHRGGGLYAYWSSPIFVNCTVIGNKALEGGGVGSFGRDYIPELVANPTLINCVLRNNRAPLGPEGALINTIRVWSWGEHTEMTISHCNIEGGQDAIFVDVDCILHWGEGNVDIEPNFVNAGYWDDANTPTEPNDDFFVTGNYHLMPISGCVDIGDNNSVPELSDSDIDGEERIFGGIVDMGADEFVTNPIDLNNDGIVDYSELAVLTDEWLQGSELQADFYDDDFIDFADFAVLAEQWFWQGGWYQ